MKSASTAVCTPQRATAVGGRVHRRDSSSEVQLYLSKLRRLLPARPGARRLTKLEVIQSVIDYICDLQYCLEMPLEAVDASLKTTAVQLPAEALSEARTSPACDEHEPAFFGGDHDRLCTAAAEVDELELEEEDLMMEEEDLEAEEDAEAESAAPAPSAPAPAPTPASQEQQGLYAPC
ncbi:protein extra-macrochaetae-like [Schistocerca gregaria]|uniref:protein extra-macrochaetae-like n=1 Tax=Schistocerca gregaria TaxID=7010 RepID=UPI00211F341F|nr:protein extra-macrochaetae-like [Schistocerca gregaria]